MSEYECEKSGPYCGHWGHPDTCEFCLREDPPDVVVELLSVVREAVGSVADDDPRLPEWQAVLEKWKMTPGPRDSPKVGEA